jgi:hypothetical protein
MNKAFHLITIQAIGVEDLNKFYKSELMARSVIIPEAQFLVPDWRDKGDYVIGLSYRPVRLHRQAGLYDNPMT